MDQNSLRIIHRYLSGECTPEEEKKVMKWIDQDPKNRETMDALQKIWSVEPHKEMESDIQMAWKHLEERMEQREQTFVPARNTSGKLLVQNRTRRVGLKTNARIATWYKVAAVFTVIALTALYASLYFIEETNEEQVAMNNVVTEKGQQAQIVLDDGSRVRLNAGSKVTHPKEFGPENRIVHLTGEAYFEVVRDGRPFLVYAGEAVIEILGTEFNVLAYEEEEIQVVVAGGKVAVRHQNASEDQAAFLERGDMASLKRDGEEMVSITHNVNLQRHLGWLDYRLEFEATPLAEVAKKLERWYEMEIHFEDPSLAGLRFTAVFEDESIDEVLEAMELSLNLEYEIEDRQIILKSDDQQE